MKKPFATAFWTALAATSLAPNAARANLDSRAWFEAGGRLEIDPIFQVDLDQHLRLDNGMARIDQLRTEVQPELEVLEWLSVHVGYMFIYVPHRRDSYEHRFTLGTAFEARFEPIRLDYRLRYQLEVGREQEYQHISRHRGRVRWRATEDFTPFTSIEAFIGHDGPSPFELDAWRLVLGTEYELGDHSIALFGAYEHEGKNQSFIVGLDYQFTVSLDPSDAE